MKALTVVVNSVKSILESGEELCCEPTWTGTIFRLLIFIWGPLLIIGVMISFVLGVVLGIIGAFLQRIMDTLYWFRFGKSAEDRFKHLNFLFGED